jgi:hypothetical protein
MLAKMNNVGRTFSRSAVSSNNIGKRIAGRAIFTAVAAIASLGFSGAVMGASIADVKSISTQMVSGKASTVSNVHGAGGSSGFTSSHTYKETFQGEDEKITKINTATSSYLPTSLATTVVERGSGPDNDTIWYRESGNYNNSTLAITSTAVGSVAQAFGGNNLLVGADNIFTNTGNNQANNTNIERLDMLFSGGITANDNNVFSIFERGLSNQHDGFKIAAITSLDGNGNPSNYGPVLTLTTGSYGKTDDVSATQYLVTRKNDSISNDAEHPSDKVVQPIGGVVIPTDVLAPVGETIFGYSLFATDVTGTGTNLVNWMNPTFFPKNSAESVAGLDLVGTAAVLYSNAQAAIPEPATGTLMLMGAAGLLARRSKRRGA